LPPPPPQAPHVGGGGGGGWAGLRDLDGCVVWYTDDSAAEADIESMASVASVDSREDDLEAAASTDSEVGSTASSTGGASSVCSGESSRGRIRDRDLSLSLCSTWSEEGEEDVLLGLSLARARMTAGKAACSCRETSCFCRFKGSGSGSDPRNQQQQQQQQQQPLNLRHLRAVPLPPPLARSELDPRDLALVAEINRMSRGARDRRGENGRAGGGGGGGGGGGDGDGGGGGGGAGSGAAAELGKELAVHPDCALEFSERFVRRDIALAGRVQAVRLLNCSTNAIFGVVVRCGGFRALYGWLGDVWERVRAHKMPRAGPPEWRGVGGSVYVEELLCVLARVPISVDMLRETEIARVAKKFRRLAERHALESMTSASNRLRAHLHAVVSRGVQEGALLIHTPRATAGPPLPQGRWGPTYQQQHESPASLPYPSRRPEPWTLKEAVSWRANGGGRGSGDLASGAALPAGGGGGGGGGSGGSGGGGGSTLAGQDHHHHPFFFMSQLKRGHPAPGLRSARLRGWRRRQGVGAADADGGGGGGGDSRAGGSDAGSARGEDDARLWEDGKGRGNASDDGRAPGQQTLRRDAEEGLQEGGGGRRSEERDGGGSGCGSGGGGGGGGGGVPAAGADSVGFSSEASSISARSSQRSAQVAGRGAAAAAGGGGGGGGGGSSGRSRGYTRRTSWRRRVSRREPWVLNLSYSGGEEERRARSLEFSSSQFGTPYARGEGGSRRGGAGEEG
ncbi:unnamed protein product, partial [Laminaria digitata]